ncbi:MAG: alpha-1,6-mannanase [Bacteroidaceae bacterium]|nr:alpha-1,6-mannanase [Bacteroidaceae bacterium]
MKKLLTILALLTITSAGLAQGESTLYRTIKENYETKADSMTRAFIESFMIKEKGVFNDKYQTYAFNAYWTQAHAIDVVVYSYERHKQDDNKTLANEFLKYIRLWYKNKANNYAVTAASSSTTPNTSTGYKMFENPFTDDMCWITLTLLHIGEATGTAAYSTIARQIFDNYIIKRANEDEETGGLWLPWNTDAGSGPNACTQSPATLIAAKLYQKYGTEKYLDYAKKLYTYTNKKIVKADYRVEEPPLTYTQGTFAEACRILYHVTDESATTKGKYKNFAYQYLNYAFTSTRCTSGSNILRDEGSSGDQSIFKAVLIPYAVNFVLDTEMTTQYRKNIADYIQKNAAEMYSHLNWDRYPIVFCNFNWKTPWTGEDKDASMGAMCSGASLLENTARMQKAIIENYQDYQDGIETIPTAEEPKNIYAVYTLDGRMVRAPWQGAEGLPKGMYVINRRKVLIK